MKKQVLIAVLREHGKNYKETRIDSDYSTKKAYASDCRANGYYVTCILTLKEAKEIQECDRNPHTMDFKELMKIMEKYDDETISIIGIMKLPELTEEEENALEKGISLENFRISKALQAEEQETTPEEETTEETEAEELEVTPTEETAKNTELSAFKYKINIMEALKKAGFTSTRIRKSHLFAQVTLQKFRKGDTNISLQTVADICYLTGLKPWDILEYQEATKEEADEIARKHNEESKKELEESKKLMEEIKQKYHLKSTENSADDTTEEPETEEQEATPEEETTKSTENSAEEATEEPETEEQEATPTEETTEEVTEEPATEEQETIDFEIPENLENEEIEKLDLTIEKSIEKQISVIS